MAEVLDISSWYRHIGLTVEEFRLIPDEMKHDARQPNKCIMFDNEEERKILEGFCPELKNEKYEQDYFMIIIGDY